ncbi:formylglycine-generating enzyme family protein [Subtercola sp. PAMC28395]|uniref:formylglycine-generating enzyme family protein n=1 Tax=Subtercola sp. PAMC28395 TaxID=2846775 RepID=UPI001C0CD737|nr:formylglycine-generating enzyme family protein [Subtercola sp. PAMC28395]QWT23924.1 formylglycine-generating enzyme family protein [Subtercola sp. PAMC28395]
MVLVPGGSFRMGSDDHYAEEAPAHLVTVSDIFIDRHQVTNAEFAAFVAATGYITVAERPLDPADYPGAPIENLAPGSLVFTGTSGPVDLRDLMQWWAWTPGASWRTPRGPGSTIDEVLDHPVVQVAHEDAAAFAAWAGKDLPTEAEWEHAARGGLDGSTFTWGNEPEGADLKRANYWHGQFPWRAESGYGSTMPVGSFPANGFGLFDTAGNVWEWTNDWYAQGHAAEPVDACCAPIDPRGAEEEASFDPMQPQFRIPRRVVKGGSFLCADTYCLRYRPAARRPQPVDTGMSHIGFRCVRRP